MCIITACYLNNFLNFRFFFLSFFAQNLLLIIVFFEFKKVIVPASRCQKKRMILKRFRSMTVFSEALLSSIIVMTNGFACPIRMTFYTKVVVGLFSQPAVPGTRLQNSLCQRNTSRNSVVPHVVLSNFFILINVVFDYIGIHRNVRSCL